MTEHPDNPVNEDHLLSADLRSTGFIVILFLFSMALMLQVFSPCSFDGSGCQNYPENQVLSETGNEKPQKPSEKTTIIPSEKNRLKSPGLRLPPFKGKKGEHAFHPIIQKVSRQNDVEPALVKAVIMAESGYNPQAVSPVGAMGLMQLMPQTAESLGVQNSFNPEQNIEGGTRYLKQLIDRLDGNITLALAAYNAGLRHVLNYNGVPPFKATEHYIYKVFHYYEYYRKADPGQTVENDAEDKNNTKPVYEETEQA